MGKSPFQLAVIGCGRWGINHVRTAEKRFGDAFTHVVDVDNSRQEKIEGISSRIRFTDNIEEVWDNPEINAVCIATPAATHYELTKKALENGKHVLVEKPLALFSHQARALDKLAAYQERILMVGHILLYHPAVRKIKQIIEDGVLGKLQYIYSNRLNLGTVRKEENILWSFAPHDISVLQYLVEADPIEVDAKGGIYLQPGIHDVTLTTLTYPEGIQAHIHVSWLHPFKEQRLVVIGDRSMVVFEDTRTANKLMLYPKGIDWINGEPIKRDEGAQVILYEEQAPLEVELEYFRECVIQKKKPETDGQHAIKVLEILEKAQKKLETHSYANAAGGKQTMSKSGNMQKYFVHETAVVDRGCKIGEGSKIWHFSHVQQNAQIGRECSIGQNVNIANNVRMGHFVKIQNNVSIYEGVELEDYVFCGPSMVFTNILNPRCEYPQRGSKHYLPTLVKYGASIGANATIVCGITIGRFAFIGAGAVVTSDVPDYALMVGNPARQIGWMCRCGERLVFSQSAFAACQKCDRKYQRQEDEMIECLNEEKISLSS